MNLLEHPVKYCFLAKLVQSLTFASYHASRCGHWLDRGLDGRCGRSLDSGWCLDAFQLWPGLPKGSVAMWPRSRNTLVSAQLAFRLMTDITINHFFVGSLAKTRKLSWVFFAGERASIDNGLIMEFFSTWQWEYWLPACLSAPMTLSATMIASRWAFSNWLLKIDNTLKLWWYHEGKKMVVLPPLVHLHVHHGRRQRPPCQSPRLHLLQKGQCQS